MSRPLPVRRPSPWPRRFVLAAAAALVPLFLFGGTVTTIGAGMAVEGWWNAEGHFMPLFPIEKWFRDLHTFVEHSHRQFGMVIGALMLCACVATWLRDGRRSARVLVLVTTLAIVFQGWLGGSRVLEASPAFAFLHGAFAQAVFALLIITAAHQSRAWREGRTRGGETRVERPRETAGLRRAAIVASAVVYLQIVVGAWYRHGLRNGLGESVTTRLALHVVLAVLVFVLVVRLAEAARTVAGDGAEGDAAGDRRAPLMRLRRGLVASLLTQVLLGMLAWATHDPASTGFAEWAFATLHVFVGAALLGHCVLVALWAGRAPSPETEPIGAQPAEVTA